MSDGSNPSGESNSILSAGAPAAVSDPTPSAAPVETPAAPNFEDLPKWTAALTPATRTKHFEALKAINGPEDITNMAFDLKGKLDGAIVPPGENASQEDVNAYLEKIGVPLDKSNYKFDVPDGSGISTMVEGLRDLAFNNRIPAEAAEAISNFLVESEKSAVQKLEADMNRIKEESMVTLTKKYGDKTEAKIARANAMLKNNATDEFRSFLDDTGVGNNSEFIDQMITFSEMISDDKLDLGSSQGPRAADDYYSFPNTPGME